MFDPYHKWLGIAPKHQPPNHYRLLGIDTFESDPEVIDAAANRQMGYLQQRATGEHAALSQKLLNELAAARLCLLNEGRRAEYDADLKKTLESGGKSDERPAAMTAEDEAIPPIPPAIATVAPTSHPPVPAAATGAEASATTANKLASEVPDEGLGQLAEQISQRLRDAEPWHYAVVIGPLILAAFGCWVVFFADPVGDSNVQSRSEPITPSVDTNEVAEADRDSTNSPSASPSETVSEPDDNGETVADAVATPGSSPDSETKNEESAYRVWVHPFNAKLNIVYGQAETSGFGTSRTVVMKGDDVLLEIACDGYETEREWLRPLIDDDFRLDISLERKKAEVRKPRPSARAKTTSVLRGHTGGVQCVAVSPDGQFIASGSMDRTVRLWNLDTGEELWKKQAFSNWIWAVSFTPDSRHVWACGEREAKCFAVTNGGSTQTLQVHNPQISGWPSCAFSYDAERLVTCANGKLHVYDLTAMKSILQMDETWITRVLFNSQRQILCGGNEGVGKVDLRSGTTGNVIRSFHALRDRTMALAISKDQKYIAAASGPAKKHQRPCENKVSVWRSAGGRLCDLSVSEGWQYTLAFSPDGRYLAGGGCGTEADWHAVERGSDPSIRIWEIPSGRFLRRLEGHAAAVKCLTFTPDGRFLVSGGDNNVRVWPFQP